jgi:hypothetical protein
MPKVDLSELQGAVEWVSDRLADAEAYVCRQTGRIYWLSEEVESEQETLPVDLDDPAKYAPVPDTYELNVGTKLAFDFTMDHLPNRYDDVRAIFRRKGAYRRFKTLLTEYELLATWFAFSEEKTSAALRDWCKSEGFAIKSTDHSRS